MYAVITIRYPQHTHITVRMFNTYDAAFSYVKVFSPSTSPSDIVDNGRGQKTYKFLPVENGHGDIIEYYITEDVNENAPDEIEQIDMFHLLDV